jgi:hypothetical protein
VSHRDATKFGCASSTYILTFTTTSIAQVSHNIKLIVCFTDIFKPKYIGECKLQFLNTNYDFTGTYTIDRREGEDRADANERGVQRGGGWVYAPWQQQLQPQLQRRCQMANKHTNGGQTNKQMANKQTNNKQINKQTANK